MSEEEDLIDGQFQTVMCIASGSASQVWEVVDKASSRHMAMKLLKRDVDKAEFKLNKAQIKREADIHKTLNHPCIVKFEHFSTNRDYTYILMEHFRASNIKIQIKNELNKVQLQARQLFEGVTAALGHVHQQGFVHRDIKPDNILLNRAGEVRLCDFSLSSKQLKGVGKLFAGKLKVIQGTRTYIAPETIRKQQPTIQTDFYSLGIVFFEVLTARTVFQAPHPEELLQKHLRTEAPNPSEFNPNVSPDMDRLIARLLKKKPQDRPASADEILSELRRIRIFKEDVLDDIAMKEANKEKDTLSELSEARLDSRADAKLKGLLETNPEFARKWEEEKEKKLEKKRIAAAIETARKKTVQAAEDAKDKASASKKKTAAPAPAPQPAAQPAPMPMQAFPQAYPGYPPGYVPYPQGQQPMMPMPGMQYPPQPGMAYPQPMGQPPQAYPQPQQPYPQPAQQPPAQQPAAQTRQQAPAGAPPKQPAPQPKQAAAQPKQAAPQPKQAAPQPKPQPAKPAQPPAANTAQRKQPPAAPAKPAAPGGARQPQQPSPPKQSLDDLDLMTELPDVL